MSSLIDKVLKHKNAAREHRDFNEWFEAVGEYNRGIELLESTEGDIRKRLEDAAKEAGAGRRVTELEKELVSGLADCYGGRGGVQRRWGRDHHGESLVSYELGYRIEAFPLYELVDTYNTVNRIVARVLLRPRWASGGSWDDAADAENEPDIDAPESLGALAAEATMARMLEGARERLNARVKRLAAEGKTDPWAEADAVMLDALRLDESTDDLNRSISQFDDTRPPRGAYTSGYTTVALLADLEIPQHDKLCIVRDHFKASAGA